MIPNSYIPVTWRNTLPVERSSAGIGIGFNTPDDRVLRLKLDVSDAKHLTQSITEYLELQGHSKPPK